MIRRGRAYSDEEIFEVLHPLVREWFMKKYGTFTPPQRYSIVEAVKGNNVLITSPTGSGKTLAGFLPVISMLIDLAEKGKLEDRVYAVYVSPLRALNNDIRRNLEEPLNEIYKLAERKGVKLQEIRIAVRTGDTRADERQKQLRKPPHILITTPETLAIILSSPRFSNYLRNVKYLIVDEIHAVAENKRGSHLSLSIERLENIQNGKMVRIGLSATIHPLDEVARFLVGYRDGVERDCIVADVTFEKNMDIRVLSPIDDFFNIRADEISSRLYNLLAELVRSSKTALIFTNTRSATERVVYHLKKILKDYPIKAHHSSLSRELRLEVEEDLKAGRLKAVVCVLPDSRVITDRGLEIISEISGSKILGISDFRSRLVRFERPQTVDYNGRGYLIETDLGFRIGVTDDHRFLTIEKGKIKWIRACELKEGDYVGVLRRIRSDNVRMGIEEFMADGICLKLRRKFVQRLIRKVKRNFDRISKHPMLKSQDILKAIVSRGRMEWRKLKVLLDAVGEKIKSEFIERIYINNESYSLGEFRAHVAYKLGCVLEDVWKSDFSVHELMENDERDFLRLFWDLIGDKRKVLRLLYSLSLDLKANFLIGCFRKMGFLKHEGKRILTGFQISCREYAEVIRDILLYFGIVSSIEEISGKYVVHVLDEYVKEFLKTVKLNCKTRSLSSNSDVIPDVTEKLNEIRIKLGIDGMSSKGLKVNNGRICRKGMIKLLRFYLKEARKKGMSDVSDEIRGLLRLAEGDVLFDRVRRIERIYIGKAYGIIDSETQNYVVNGFISKNSSTSLELGIDIGYIDLVILLGSPKSINRALQRVGRSGHRLHETSVGRIVVLDQDDLVECVVLAKEAMERRLDRIHIPKKPLDVLCQHVVGMAIEKKWKVDEALNLIRRAYPYRDLTREDFIDVLRYLSGKYSKLEKEKVYGKIWFDEERMEFGKRTKLLRPIYYLNVGTIPDEVLINVITKDGRFIGKVEEEFAERLITGDVFVLAGRTFRFLYSRGMSIIVEEVEGEKPTVPSWFSEQLPLSYDLALRIQRFRGILDEMIERVLREEKESSGIIGFLMEEFGIDERTAFAIFKYFLEQKLFSKIPTDKRLVVEEFRDGLGFCYVFHTLVGRRANDAISRVFAYRIGSAKNCSVKISITDNGFMLRLPVRLKRDEILSLFNLKGFREDLIRSIDKTELLRRRFRHVAVRSFMILRNYLGREKSVWKQQISADNILKLLKRYFPNFPVIRETYREIVEDFMDIENAMDYLSRIGDEIKVEVVEVPSPSPFSLNIYLVGEEDVVLMEDRRKILKRLHEMVLRRIREKSGSCAER